MRILFAISILVSCCSFAQTEYDAMAVFTGWRDKRNFAQFLKDHPLDRKSSILYTNPILKSQEWNDLDYAAASVFELTTIDERIENRIVIRNYRETHTDLHFFQISAGLPEATLKWINDRLEAILMNSYLIAINCYVGGEISFHGLNYFDLLVTPGLISFAYADNYNCNGMPWYEPHAVNLNIETLRELTNEALLTSKALGQIGDGYGDIPWVTLAKRVLKPEESDDCPTEPEAYLAGNPELLISRNGLRVINDFPDYLCSNPQWAVIPFDSIQNFLQPEIVELTKTLKP